MYEKDLNKEKQMISDLIEIFGEEFSKRYLITPQNTAEKLTAKGYRKASEVAEEIFEEIYESIKAEKFHHKSFGDLVYLADIDRIFAELKKKYTEEKEDGI